MSRNNYNFLIVILTIFTFAIIVYLDEKIGLTSNLSILYLLLKYLSVSGFGLLIFLFNKKNKNIKININIKLIIISSFIFLGNFLGTLYYIEIYSLSHEYFFIKVIINEDIKVILNILSGYFLGFALLSEAQNNKNDSL